MHTHVTCSITFDLVRHAQAQQRKKKHEPLLEACLREEQRAQVVVAVADGSTSTVSFLWHHWSRVSSTRQSAHLMLSGCSRVRMNSVDRMNASTIAWHDRKMYRKLRATDDRQLLGLLQARYNARVFERWPRFLFYK